MKTKPGKGRRFYVYGMAPFALGLRHENVIEETEWAPDEMHRCGMARIAHLGPVCFGVGEFEIGLSLEEIEAIEKEAVWLDDVEPGEIGRWKGDAVAKEYTALGFEYQPKASASTGQDESDGAEALD